MKLQVAVAAVGELMTNANMSPEAWHYVLDCLRADPNVFVGQAPVNSRHELP